MTTATTLASSPPLAGASSAALVFRRDEPGTVFPMAGAVLLLALIAVAAWAWFVARRRGVSDGGRAWVGGAMRGFGGSRTGASGGGVRIVGRARADAQTRLLVVEWQRRRYLLAVTGVSTPVVIDREEVDPAMPGG